MQADVVKLRKALMALLDNVDEACAAIRAVVIANLVSEIKEVDTTLLHINNLAFDLGNLSLECREAVVAEDEAKIDQDLVEDEAVAAEWDSLSTPSPPMTLEEHCKWSMGPNCPQNWYMAPNWASFVMSDPLMAAMAPDGGQPPVLPPQVEVPVREGTSKDPGSSSKGKKSGTKLKLSNFSNAEDNILIAEAIKRYNSLEKRPFAVPHCWAVLKNEAKWLDLPNKRPMGRDAAKESQQRASSTSGSQNEEYLSKMSEMCL
ncbi:hypothetical protein BAE44_0001947 [Dichanthelium oligosanthes]|uniref:No apical meristem-associated C-terminal domain-containing protein n=1 Tax=Dichanthelium oligosanthes TaxID=888268 RepID=A0A1E5WI73_9POAL|nr:hypothetical protein BAE44_0001947 [Dichanthelium oligosanthes]